MCLADDLRRDLVDVEHPRERARHVIEDGELLVAAERLGRERELLDLTLVQVLDELRNLRDASAAQDGADLDAARDDRHALGPVAAAQEDLSVQVLDTHGLREQREHVLDGALVRPSKQASEVETSRFTRHDCFAP